MRLRQSQAYIALVFLLGLVLVGFTITVLMKPMNVVYNSTYNDSAVNESIYQEFYTRTTTVWIWIPVLLAIGLLIWALAKAHERQGGYN